MKIEQNHQESQPEKTDLESISLDKSHLIRKVIQRFASGVLIIALIFFLMAGTWRYWNAWIYLAAAIIPMVLELIYLVQNDPELLRKRLKHRETEREQRAAIKWSIILTMIAYLIPGLDFRWGWSDVPIWMVAAGLVFYEFGYALFAKVMRQNSYASRVIEIQEGHQLIDTGLYAKVRHPLYAANLMMSLSLPFILGSYWALIPTVFCIAPIIQRIHNEEAVLKNGLEGYADYTTRVKYRLIPHIW